MCFSCLYHTCTAFLHVSLTAYSWGNLKHFIGDIIHWDIANKYLLWSRGVKSPTELAAATDIWYKWLIKGLLITTISSPVKTFITTCLIIITLHILVIKTCIKLSSEWTMWVLKTLTECKWFTKMKEMVIYYISKTKKSFGKLMI